ncbi:MAG: diguanylate cyclase [Treponema sp.]|nr:diguanylate cyclase [Treponema sp.]
MNKSSIRLKLTILLYAVILGLYLVMWAITSPVVRKIIENNNSQSMILLSNEKVNELNTYMKNVERAVGVLENYIYENLDTDRMLTDEEYTKKFMETLENRSVNIASVAGNVTAIYFRPDPLIYGSQSGIFMMGSKSGNFLSTAPTDILAYPSNDREHVGWFYEPKQKGTPLWMEPYSNKNINVYMISYVIPMYHSDGSFMGVVGMDMSMAAIHKVVDNINYQEGFGFILNSTGSLVYHPEYQNGLSSLLFNDELLSVSSLMLSSAAKLESKVYRYLWHEKENYAIAANMQNGMILAISAPVSNVMEPAARIRINMILLLLVSLLALFISIRIVIRHIVKPIADITMAASRISKGELNVSIEYNSHDEIGQLADSVKKMSTELQEYLAYIQKQAFTDAMTSVGNKTAYMEFIKNLELRIHEGMADFLLIVFDVNGLKQINDNLGHEAGDALISDAGKVLKASFGNKEFDHIYRIGGDEFAVILEHVGEKDLDSIFQKYRAELAELNKEEHVYGSELSISYGHAFSQPEEEFKSVFQRADEKMYLNKQAFYSGRNDRRRR